MACDLIGTSTSRHVSADDCSGRSSARTRLVESAIGLVEDVRSAGVPVWTSEEGFSPHFQICLPYRGLFRWHVGGDDVVADPNQVLFVSGGESFHLSQPHYHAYAELIITPDPGLLAELADVDEARLSLHPLFRRRSRRSNTRLQFLRARFLHGLTGEQPDGVAVEQLVIDVLRLALQVDVRKREAGPRTRRLIARTKEFLEARVADRIRLTDIANAVGASASHLTDAFNRVEGVPLHRYLVQLRLARALAELPDVDDITTLAFDLGFSSHSHFTAAFRKAYGCTPSQFRGPTRTSRRIERASWG